MSVRITHIGGPTALIDLGEWRLLTDPTFDAPGRRYTFGWGSSSRKLTGPAITPADLGPVDAVPHGKHLRVMPADQLRVLRSSRQQS